MTGLPALVLGLLIALVTTWWVLWDTPSFLEFGRWLFTPSTRVRCTVGRVMAGSSLLVILLVVYVPFFSAVVVTADAVDWTNARVWGLIRIAFTHLSLVIIFLVGAIMGIDNEGADE